MTRSLGCLCLALAFATAPSLRPQTPDAKAELDLGIAAYERGLDGDAIQHLRRAVSLEPTSVSGHYYLALVHNLRCLPLSSFCDAESAKWAIEEYTKVLELDPTHAEALKGKGRLLYRLQLSDNHTLQRLDDAERLYRKAAMLNPSDPEALYAVAAFDWIRTNRALVEERSRFGLSVGQPMIGLPTCRETRAKALPDVEEGLALLTRVLRVVRSVDAQVYLASLYMERAELRCGDRAAYKGDRRTERQWRNRACVTWQQTNGNLVPRRWLPSPPPPPPGREDTCSWSRN